MEEAYPTRDDVRFGEVDRPSQGSDHFGIGDVVGIQQKDEIRISASNARISRSAKIAIALAKQSKIQGSIPLFNAGEITCRLSALAPVVDHQDRKIPIRLLRQRFQILIE